MKPNFQDLAKTFTPTPSYRVNVMWDYLEDHLAHWSERAKNEQEALNLEPDFQRGHVWTIKQQIAYVEYILQGGMSGREIYFNCTGWMKNWEGPFVIVDGKQRLQAARLFMADKLPVFGELYPKPVTGLFDDKGKIQYKGYLRSEIEGRLGLNAGFVFCVNDLKTRAEVLKWYLEMNTGGTPHTDAEIKKVKTMLAECK